MIKHIFLMIWNQKGRNIGLLLEIFFSFIVLFAVSTYIIYQYNIYHQNLGFNYENIWMLQMDARESNAKEIAQTKDQIARYLKQQTEIQSFSYSSNNMPYGSSSSMTVLNHNGKETYPDYFQAEPSFLETFQLELMEGRWLKEDDKAANAIPIVINSELKKELFEDEDVINLELLDDEGNTEFKIVGILDQFKFQGEFSPARSGFFRLMPDSLDYPGSMAIKLQPTVGAAFEAKLMKQLNKIAGNWSFNISYMEESRKNRLRETQVPMIVLMTICGFLLFNVALGLFGILWSNINKRKAEIGIRRAMGATKNGLNWQFIGEMMMICTFSLVLSTFFAIQLPLLKVFSGPPFFISVWIYFLAIFVSILIIYGIVLICSYFPSRQAAQLHPAVALHEE